VAWTHAGNALATCGEDRTIRIWRPVRRKDAPDEWVCAAVLDDAHTRTVRSVAWSPCDTYLCACSFDGLTSIWEQSKDGSVKTFESIATLEGHENEVKRVTWSPNGELIATCGRDKTVWVWEVGDEVANGEFDCIAICNGHTQDVKSVTWHPEQEAVFSTSYDDTIRVWREREGDDEWTCTSVLSKHASTVWDMSFEPSGGGKRFVSCSADRSVVLWQETEKREWAHVETLEGHHTREIYSISWSVDGIVASGGGDNAIVISNVRDGRFVDKPRVHARAHAGDVNCVRWSPLAGGALASCSDDGLVRIWGLRARR